MVYVAFEQLLDRSRRCRHPSPAEGNVIPGAFTLLSSAAPSGMEPWRMLARKLRRWQVMTPTESFTDRPTEPRGGVNNP